MKLVKSLQHRKEEALKRRANLKQAVACATQSPDVKLSRIIQKIGSTAVMAPLEFAGPPSSSSMVLSKAKRPLAEADALQPSDNTVPVVPKCLSDCVQRFFLHSELSSGDVVIEMICEQIPNFHSALLKSMESLGLEVIRCSVSQAVNKVICNITVRVSNFCQPHPLVSFQFS